MIGTIGSLVQETSRRRWLLAVSMYTLACICASLLLGASLSLAGHLAGTALGGAVGAVAPLFKHISWPTFSVVIVGALGLAYAASDMGWIDLPRPHVRDAVPITWWRRWRPYGAAVVYGAALGIGFMTRIPFGAFYVLLVAVLLRGDPLLGMAVFGAYGAARALVMVPASWGVSRRRAHLVAWLQGPLFDVDLAQEILAAVLMAFATTVLVATVLPH